MEILLLIIGLSLIGSLVHIKKSILSLEQRINEIEASLTEEIRASGIDKEPNDPFV